MRILINSINYHPELTGIGKYTGEMAEWLAAQGCEVKVVTAPPYYPAWKIADNYPRFTYRREDINGVFVIRCPLWVPRIPSGVKRMLHLTTFVVTSFPVMLWNALIWKPNLVFVIEPPLFCAFGAIVAGKLARSDTWLHVQDFEVDAAFELGMLKNPRLRKLIETAEQWLMNKFHRVSTISDRMIDRLGSKGVAHDRCIKFENWVDLEQIQPLDNGLEFRRELGIPENATVLLYSGNMGKKQGLELVVEAAKRLRNRKDLCFVLCGDGVVRPELERMLAGCGNVQFLPLQPINKLNALLNTADIHLLPQRAGAEDLVMPSKLTNMLASGKPVIATAGSGSQIEAVVGEAGAVVEPGNVEDFIKSIERFVDGPDLRQRAGLYGREYAVKFLDKEKILSKTFSDYLNKS